MQKLLDYFRSIFDTETSGRLILFSPLVGIVAGLGAVAFYYLLELVQQFSLWQMEGYFPPSAGSEGGAHPHPIQLPTIWWAVILVPVVGGLICGWLVYGFAPEAEGHGTDAVVRSFHRLGGRIRARVPFIKSIASVLTIGTGGAAGREGPIAQIGAGFGSFLATKLGLGEHERRLLMLCGGAGGIGAIFRAPLGGALFLSEVLYGSTALEYAAVIPNFIAAITAYTVFTSIFGQGLAFHTSPDLVFNLAEIPFYLVFAIICSLVGYLYVLVFYGLRDHFFRKIPMPNMLKPAFGGLLLGVMALWLPQIMSGGYGWIQLLIDGKPVSEWFPQIMAQGGTWVHAMDSKVIASFLLLILCFGKILATSLTISSGGSGGVFAPSLFIGAMLGGAYGQLCTHLFPGIITHPDVFMEAFVLVGMGGFFAGVARVPLTSILMVCEMSGSYGLLIPLMIVSIINVALLSRRWTLYEEQVRAMVDSPAHQGDFVIDVLEQIRVRDVHHKMSNVDLVSVNTPLPEILKLAANSKSTYFPVVNDRNQLVGIFSLRDLRSVLLGEGAGNLILAIDLATTPVLTVTPDDDLHTALRRFTQKNIDELPIVNTDDPTEVIGMLSRKDVIAAYHDRVTELQHAGEEEMEDA